MLLESLPAKPFEVCGTSQEITPRLLTSSHASASLIIFRHPPALSASVAKFANDIVTQSDSYYCRRDALFPDLGGCHNTHPQSKHAVEVHLGTVPLEVQGSDVMPIKQHTATQRIIEALKQCHLELWSKFYWFLHFKSFQDVGWQRQRGLGVQMCSNVMLRSFHPSLKILYQSGRVTLVLLPQPLGPTRAVVVPGSTMKLKPSNTGRFGRVA